MFKYLFVFQKLIIGIVFLLGLINAINPRLLWEKFESWKAKEEPSSTYFMVRRISGFLAMTVAALMIFYPYFL